MARQVTVKPAPVRRSTSANLNTRATKYLAKHANSFCALGQSGHGARPRDQQLPALAYGTIWLVSTRDCDPDRLSPLVQHALRAADAVLHDPEIPARLLHLVKPPGYREPADPHRAPIRAIKLAEDGWRVVWLVGHETMKCVVEAAASFYQRGIPVQVALDATDANSTEIKYDLLRASFSPSWTAADRTTVLLASTSPKPAQQREPPVSFWMSGLAG